MTMADLRVGDLVLAVDRSGRLVFEEVYLFSHKATNGFAEFVELTIEDGRRLRLTSRHFLPRCVRGDVSTSEELESTANVNCEIVAADEIVIGDSLQVAVGIMGPTASTTELRKVTAVRRVVDMGVYAPLTMGGMIVVDGVVASAHSDFVLDRFGVSPAWQHNIYQAVGGVARAIYRMVGAETAAWLAEDHGMDLTNRIISLERIICSSILAILDRDSWAGMARFQTVF